MQVRTCTQSNCNSVASSKTESQACCSPNWQDVSGAELACVNGQKTRTVYDSNKCGVLQKQETVPCVCVPDWKFNEWNSCYDSTQSRYVWDNNNCGIYDDPNKPLEAQTCCSPVWVCSDFGACYQGKKYSTCRDTNNCGVLTNKPDTEALCIDASVNIKANGSDGPINLSANSSTPVNLTWTSTGYIYSCTASGDWSGNKQGSGSEYASTYNSPVLGSYSYVITCDYNDNGTNGRVTDSVTVNYTEPSISLKINNSYSNQTQINSGSAVVISWQAQNAVSCNASGGWSGSKAVSGSENSAIITSNKIFTLTCIDAVGNSRSASSSVNIIAGSGSSVSIKANDLDGPVYVRKGDYVAVSWSSVNVRSCSDAGGLESSSIGTEGYLSQTAVSTKTYSITCLGVDVATVTDSVTVNVASVVLKSGNSVGPLSLALYSQPINLTWVTTGGVTSCLASGDWSGEKGANGTTSVGNFSTQRTYTYSLNCSSPGGSVSTSFVVNVSPTTVDIKVNGSNGPVTIASGNSVNINWTTNNASSCVASGGTNWTGSKASSGGPEYSEYIFVNKIFVLTCKDALGNNVSDRVEVNLNNVVEPPAVIPPSVSIKVNGSAGPLSLPINSQPINLVWTTAGGVTGCTAGGDWSGDKGTGGTAQVGNFTSAKAYTYTLNCASPGGNVSTSFVANVNILASLTLNGQSNTVTVSRFSTIVVDWSSTGAESCSILYPGFGFLSKGLSGREYLYGSDIPVGTDIISLACIGANNSSVTKSVTLIVNNLFIFTVKFHNCHTKLNT